MFPLFSKQKPIFGLEITNSTLRLMQLQQEQGSFYTSAFAKKDLPKGVVNDSQVLNPGKLADIITKAMKSPDFGKFEGQFAVASVPESKSFVRVISLPKMSEAEAKEAVPFEAEQYIPVSIDQVYLDFLILPKKSTSDGKMNALISATPKNIVDSYVEVLKQAKIKPLAMEVESEAIARCLIPEKKRNEPTLIVDIGHTQTSIIIYDEKTLQFTSSVPVAGASFTSQIAQKLSISQDEAEKLKVQVGIDLRKDERNLRQILEPQIHSIIEAINNAINFYKEHSTGSREVKTVYLSGGGSRLRSLPEYMDTELRKMRGTTIGRMVSIGDPWVNVFSGKMKKVPPISKSDSITFATVIGLALRGFEEE